MKCKRCLQEMGATQTQCRVCGKRITRVRKLSLGIACFAAGLALGWAVLRGVRLSDELSASNPKHLARLGGFLLFFTGLALWQLHAARRNRRTSEDER